MALIAGRLCVLAFLLLQVSGLLSSVRADPPDTAGVGYTQKLGADVPLDARLVEPNGRQQTLARLINGKPTVLILGYYACPSLCGLIRDDAFSALANTNLTTPRDYSLVFLSIDPAEQPRDAATAFDHDVAQYPITGGAEGWHFTTADASTIEQIETAVGYNSRFDVKLKQFIHPAGLVILTPAGKVSSYLLDVSFQPGALQAAIGAASRGTVGQRASPILLLCFHYDPTTGRYTLAIMKVLRLTAILSVLTVVGLIVLLRRQGTHA